VVVAVLLLWWMLRGQEPEQIWSRMLEVSVVGVLLGGMLNVGHNFFRVWRWRALLHPVREGVAFRPMFTAVILGYFVTWIVPARLGEVVRPALLSARERLPLAACMGTIVADRFLDGLTIVALFAIGTLITPLEGEAARYVALLRTGSLGLLAVLALVVVFLVMASSMRGRLGGWLASRRGVLAWIGRAVLSFSQGIEALSRPKLLARVSLHSLLAWLAIALGLWIGVRACGAQIPFGAMLIILPATALGIALPTPGGLGGFNVALATGLQIFLVEEATASSAGILVWVMCIVPVLILGPILLVVDRVSFGDMLAAAKQVKQLGSSANVVPGDGPEVEQAP
jgi:uncharacterized protein (TIRG00374 family)